MASTKRSTSGDEFARIARIAQILAAPSPDRSAAGAGGPARDPSIELAIGDDAAVLDPTRLREGEKLVWTVDASIEGVHFRRSWIDPGGVGFRAVVAATSDVLAMGARPIAALTAWTLPTSFDDEAVDELARGEKEAADLLGMAVIGGNLAVGDRLTLTTTVLGAARTPVGRSGARAGDRIVLLGPVGEAALGARCLEAGASGVDSPSAFLAIPAVTRAVAAWRRPPVLMRGARSLADVAHAMIDVSDGLGQDLGHLAGASGVRAVISANALAARRDPALAALAVQLGVDIAHLELAGGEDYALVAALPRDLEPPCGDVIGHFEPPKEGEPTVVIEDGGVQRPAPEGWRHRGVR